MPNVARGESDLVPVAHALSTVKARAKSPSATQEPLPGFEMFITPRDIGYTHPIFVQCFLPVRHNPKYNRRWQVNNGNASLLVLAGEVIDPHRPGTYKQCMVPAGSKAYLIANYINDYALTRRTRTIPIGRSLREGMEKFGVRCGGKNGKELQRELENFITSTIHLGEWHPGGRAAVQQLVQISEQISFWSEDDRQRSMWRSEVLLSQHYYDRLSSRDMAPIYWPALVALQHNPRAMGIHTWLVYTLRTKLKRDKLVFSVEALHHLFGQGNASRRGFWQEFKLSLAEALRWYPTARVEILGDGSGLALRSSPSLIPFDKKHRL